MFYFTLTSFLLLFELDSSGQIADG
jgi:hypothetical protein